MNTARMVFLAALLLLIPSSAAPGQSIVREMPSPAAAPSGEPNLVAARDGRVYLSWIESVGDNGHALKFSALRNGKWSAPRTVAQGAGWFVNWADFPSLLILQNGAMAAHWLVKSGPDSYAYNVHVSTSRDDGRTWSKPIILHRDGTQTEHGFVSLVPWRRGEVGAVWLDGRKFKPRPEGHNDHGSAEDEMTLRWTTFGMNGRMSDEVMLDGRVCECCQTSAAITAEGPIVVYRNRSEQEVRDTAVVRMVNGKWTAPRVLHDDGWKIEGCPVNGPSVAASGRSVAVAWFTAAADTPQVKLAFSSDSGATFSQPVQVDDGAPIGRVEVAAMPGGDVLVLWMERVATGAEVRVRRIRPDGSRDRAVTVASTAAARASGFPRMARSGSDLVFAWTDPGKPSRVRTATLRLADYR